MFVSRRVSILALSTLLVLPLGCSKPEPEGPKIVAGEMPVGGDWTGVYYDQFYGNLHLVREGDAIEGKWRTTNGDIWGELHGDIEGNLLRYEWVEHKIGMVGPSGQVSGKGYFLYKDSDVENDPDFIEGERGRGKSSSGNKWMAVKQNNVQPDLNSVMPDEVENRDTTDGWDGEGNESKSDEGGGESSSEEPSTSDSESSGDQGGGDSDLSY